MRGKCTPPSSSTGVRPSNRDRSRLGVLREAREVADADDDVVLPAGRNAKTSVAAAEILEDRCRRRVLLADLDQPAGPVQNDVGERISASTWTALIAVHGVEHSGR